MSNKPPRDRGGQPSQARGEQPLSLGQIGRDEAPLLIPVPPSSSIEEITRLIRDAGASRVELLVPNDTTALQSIAGNELLREAAREAGVRISLFTSDEKTTHAARFAKLDVVSVGGTVAAPRPGSAGRRPTGPRPAVVPPRPAQPVAATPAPRPATTPPAQAGPRPASGPGPRQPASAPQQAQPAAPPGEADLLAQIDAFDQPATTGPARVHQNDQGSLLIDVAGDAGVPRPADNDDEWAAAFGELDSTMTQEAPPATSPPRRRQVPIDQPRERLPSPSIVGALLGNLPTRGRRQAREDTADEGVRMTRPTRTPDEAEARRRQSRTLTLVPLLAIVALVIAGAFLFFALGGTPGVASLLGGGPTLAIQAPINRGEAEQFSNLVVPLVREPVSDPASINVQGALLTAPVTVTLQGQAAQSVSTPIGFGRGTIVLRNQSSQAVTIPAGTQVPGGGQQFEFEQTVTVPPSVRSEVGITFGVAEATLVATNPGAEGNVPAGSITAIPGYGGITVSQPADFAGGRNETVPSVSIEDVNQLLPTALNQLYAQGVQSLQAQVQQLPGFAIVQGADTPEITPTQELLADVREDEFSVFPPIGQVAQDGTFALQMFETFSALASPVDQPIDSQIQRAVANQIRQQRSDLANATVEIQSWRRGDGSIIVDALAVPSDEVLDVPDEQLTQIQQAIAGQPRAVAQQYLDQLAADGVIGEASLPPEWETIPANVRLEVAQPGQPQP